MKFNFTLPLASSVLHSLTTKSTTVIRDQYNNLVEIPQKWADDLKHIEFNELLSSSIGPLALYFGWKKKHKEEFSELASGTLATSFVYGEPVTSLTAIVVLAYRYSKSKNGTQFISINIYTKNIIISYATIITKWRSFCGRIQY